MFTISPAFFSLFYISEIFHNNKDLSKFSFVGFFSLMILRGFGKEKGGDIVNIKDNLQNF